MVSWDKFIQGLRVACNFSQTSMALVSQGPYEVSNHWYYKQLHTLLPNGVTTSASISLVGKIGYDSLAVYTDSMNNVLAVMSNKTQPSVVNMCQALGMFNGIPFKSFQDVPNNYGSYIWYF